MTDNNKSQRQNGEDAAVDSPQAAPVTQKKARWAARILLLLLLPGLLLRVFLAWDDVDTLTVKFLPDDARGLRHHPQLALHPMGL